ncbi:hypothetical protein ACFW04_011346 [Cataglyphis niger]
MSRNKKLRLSEYWSRDKLLKSDIFTDIMSRDRYLTILQKLHFVNHNEKSSDRLHKISSVCNKLQKSFKDSFSPFQNLCIDESLLLFKGRLSFKQYIPSKRSRFGIKTYVLCNCKTGYVLDVNIYAGSETRITEDTPEIGKTGNIVLTLLKPYLGKGHTLYVDNFYSMDYNSSMGAVDKCDMIISSIQSVRKSLKWYKKYFFHLLDIAVWNAYCLYKYKTHKNISIAAFHLELIRQILEKYRKENLRQSGQRSEDKYPFRLIDRHFPAIYTSTKTTRKSALRKCIVCSKNGVQRQTHYQCKICDVGLCVCPCFETFHTKLHY